MILAPRSRRAKGGGLCGIDLGCGYIPVASAVRMNDMRRGEIGLHGASENDHTTDVRMKSPDQPASCMTDTPLT